MAFSLQQMYAPPNARVNTGPGSPYAGMNPNDPRIPSDSPGPNRSSQDINPATGRPYWDNRNPGIDYTGWTMGPNGPQPPPGMRNPFGPGVDPNSNYHVYPGVGPGVDPNSNYHVYPGVGPHLPPDPSQFVDPMPMLPDEGGQAGPWPQPQKPRGQMTRAEWIAAKLTPGPRRPRPKTFSPEQTDWLNTLGAEDQGKYGYTPPAPPAPPSAAAPTPPPPPAEGTTQNAAPPEGNQGQRVAAGASRARPRRPRARDFRNINKPRKTKPPSTDK